MSEAENKQYKLTRIDLLRHGECVDGAIYRGHTNSLLSAQGGEQMKSACLEDQWQRLYSSPLSRCHDFALQLSKSRELPLAEDSRLMEMDFGDWDGCLVDDVWKQQQQAVLDFWEDPVNCPPPNGETLTDLQHRCVQFLHDVHANHAGEHLLLVTHGGVIRVLLGYLLQMPLKALRQLSIGYGSLSRVELYQGQDASDFGSEVIFVNRQPELRAYSDD